MTSMDLQKKTKQVVALYAETMQQMRAVAVEGVTSGDLFVVREVDLSRINREASARLKKAPRFTEAGFVVEKDGKNVRVKKLRSFGDDEKLLRYSDDEVRDLAVRDSVDIDYFCNDLTSPTVCDDCGTSIKREWHVALYQKNKFKSASCWSCSMERQMAAYEKDGNITSSELIHLAITADVNRKYGDDLSSLNPKVREFCEKYMPSLVKIAAELDAINVKVKRLGALRWTQTIKPYYDASDLRGHSGQGEGFKALLWGAAGRVMLTLDGANKGALHGASATIIFDDSTEEPTGRCGGQGYRGNAKAIRALLDAAIESFPALKPDGNVGF